MLGSASVVLGGTVVELDGAAVVLMQSAWDVLAGRTAVVVVGGVVDAGVVTLRNSIRMGIADFAAIGDSVVFEFADLVDRAPHFVTHLDLEAEADWHFVVAQAVWWLVSEEEVWLV